jgi:uncharacterized repeat protein (TIGR01451 family)
MNKQISHLVVAAITILTLLAGNVRLASAQETADLALTKTANQKHVKIGETITFTITVTNLGPGTATGIVFGDSLPDPLNLVTFSCSQGVVSIQSFCAVESLASGASVTATLVATPITNPAKSERKFSNTAFIAESAAFDPNPDNNSASLDLRIIGPIH